ncbi:HtaA domain-containing protein [Streptomyces sp. AK02-01A]|uniref:HtaA domain-containing protein n=1 Tax=Streptomyces sp. AK02-01A TaxID=3028648 RepID=UPI0029A6F860|nr:HtaA domain-containing protein [Streptomyces sp. AK02-01A]MDX3849567.1 HtaA domain-containing protein [Streptomyces sp. AK02-01A]MDX3849863.1 HtaA domain-containing protein [Streptomyces sp. AK02-01A]
MPATRRPRALAAAIATAAALGATAFTLPALAAGVPAAAPAAPGAPKLELKDGTLDWGLKESFRKYVTGIAAGTISATEGATQAAGNGPFTFTGGTGTYDPATHNVTTDFDGGVRFTSAAHGFDIQIADVKLVTEGTGGAIQADVSLNGTTQDDIELAEIDLAGIRPETAAGTMVFKDIPAKLTADGAKAFNGMYAAGTELDKATLAVAYSTGGTPTPTPTPNPTESEPTPTPTATAPTGTPTGGTTPAPTAPASDAPPAAEDGAIVDGNLDWGVKESFRSYVTGPIAKGKVELSGGATQSGAAYRFSDGTGSFDADAHTLSASFAGTVRFLGHEEAGEYVLDLGLSGLRVEVKDGKGTLVADVSTKDRDTHKVATFKDLTFATLDLPAGGPVAKDGVVTLSGVPATLTADGTKAFGGMYPAGTALDKLTLAVSLDDDADLPGGGDSGGDSGGTGGDSGTTGGTTGGTVGGGTVGGTGSLASTGSEIPTGTLLSAAGAVAAAGVAVVFAAKRRRTSQEETA